MFKLQLLKVMKTDYLYFVKRDLRSYTKVFDKSKSFVLVPIY